MDLLENERIDDLEYNQLPIRKDFIENLSISIDFEQNIDAPIPSNYEIGKIKVELDNNIILISSIVNTNTIKKKSAFFYLGYFFKNLPYIMQSEL